MLRNIAQFTEQGLTNRYPSSKCQIIWSASYRGYNIQKPISRFELLGGLLSR